jgi:hypothetical protein
MFDHVKHVQEWTTMACHVYDLVYAMIKVLTIAICDMQFESTKALCVMWTKLNHVMLMFNLTNPNFKGFMAVVHMPIGMLSCVWFWRCFCEDG